MLREWVVGGSGLDGYSGEQGLPVGIQECIEGLEEALTISAGSLFKKETARMVKANWQRRIVVSMGNLRKTWVILNMDIRFSRIRRCLSELLHTEHAKTLSQTSELASAPFPMPLRRGIGWCGLRELHIQDS